MATEVPEQLRGELAAEIAAASALRRVYVKTHSGQEIALDIDPATPVARIKELLEARVHDAPPPSQQRLVICLTEGQAVSASYRAIGENPRSERTMEIWVKTMTGKEIDIAVEPEDTIARIKELVAAKEGIYPLEQRLIFGGKQMADDKSAGHYNVEGGSVLHLVLALRGGGGL